MRWRVVTLILLAAVAFAAVADRDPLSITVVGGYFQWEPATIRLKIRVQPDPANRVLLFGIDSDGFVRSSLEELDGDSPMTRWVEYQSVPAGEYTAFAIVRRADASDWHATTPMTILSR